MPIAMPSAESAERSRYPFRAEMLKRISSATSTRSPSAPRQRQHRIEARRLPRREQAEHGADADRNADRGGDGPLRRRRRERREERHERGDPRPPDREAEDAADRREQHGLGQE